MGSAGSCMQADAAGVALASSMASRRDQLRWCGPRGRDSYREAVRCSRGKSERALKEAAVWVDVASRARGMM